jgi:hypothetical protein
LGWAGAGRSVLRAAVGDVADEVACALARLGAGCVLETLADEPRLEGKNDDSGVPGAVTTVARTRRSDTIFALGSTANIANIAAAASAAPPVAKMAFRGFSTHRLLGSPCR